MFKDPYSTTICQNYLMGKVVDQIKKHAIMGGEQLVPANNPLSDRPMYGLYKVVPGLADIPPFAHPVTIVEKDSDGYERAATYVDVRSFTRRDVNGEIKVTGIMDHNFAMLRGFLQQIWHGDDWISLQNLGIYQVTMFNRWLGGMLTRRFALAPETQMRMAVISSFYYLCLFLDDHAAAGDELPENERLRIATMIARATMINAEEVLNIMTGFKVARDANGLVELIKNESQTVRFESFNLAQLYATVTGGWFGFNAKETLAVALEHPPTFIAIALMASQERGYRNTEFGRISEQYKNADNLKSFIFNAKNLQ